MSAGNKRRAEKKRMTIRDARIVLEEIESEKLLENYDVVKDAIAAVEECGIVFIDEIDKLVSSGDYRGADASSEGVQRDLLPIIEGILYIKISVTYTAIVKFIRVLGSTVTTKHGNVNTDFILFICSGAFHSSKPSDLLAELQVCLLKNLVNILFKIYEPLVSKGPLTYSCSRESAD